jgi:hypothetical protein
MTKYRSFEGYLVDISLEKIDSGACASVHIALRHRGQSRYGAFACAKGSGEG